MSKFTDNVKGRLWLFRIIDFIVVAGPVIVYAIIAFVNKETSGTGKIVLVATIVVSLILLIFNVIAQKRLRCPIWLILIGLFICIKEWLLPLIIVLAVSSVLDDFILTPLITHYKTKYIAAKTIDEKEEYESKLQ